MMGIQILVLLLNNCVVYNVLELYIPDEHWRSSFTLFICGGMISGSSLSSSFVWWISFWLNWQGENSTM